MFCGSISVNSVLLLLLVSFFSFDVYIPHQKYQVKPHSSPWFSADCAAAIVNKNHFFHLYQKDKSSGSKVKFRQASNCCRRVLEAAKLAYANKLGQKLGSWEFWLIGNFVINKGKSAVSPRFNSLEMLSFASCKAKLFTENFSKNSDLDDLVSLHQFSLLELIWNWIIFL